MEFLLKATRESRGKKKLKYLLILTCRALAIAAVIFAIARPVMGNFLGWGNAHLDTIILVLDRSASMEQLTQDEKLTKRQSALRQIRKSLKNLNNPRLILIDSASASPQEIPSPDVLEELSATSATDTHASIPKLITTAIDYITSHALGRTEIWLASDLQESDWAPDQGLWDTIRPALNHTPQKTTLRILSLSSPAKRNITVRILKTRRTNNALILDIEITRSESEGVISLPITYSLNGTRSSENITLNAQSYRYQKHLPLGNTSSAGYGFIAIPSDTNLRDNVAYFAYGKDSPTLSYLVSEGGESPIWLNIAAAPPNFGKSQCRQLPPNKAHQIDWQNATLIIWQAPLPTGPTAEELLRYIKSGGVALFFPPRGESDTAFLGIHWGKLTTSPQGQYFIVEQWNKTDGPLRNGLEGTPIPVTKLKAIKRRQILGEATTLSTWNDGEPFLLRRVIENGTAIFIATLPDYKWSNLGDADVLLPLIQRLIDLGDARLASAYASTVGSKKALPADGEIRTRLDTYSTSTSSNAPYEAGVWKLGERILATNRPAAEDIPNILSSKKLKTLLQGAPYKLFEDKTSSSDSSLTREIWQPLLVAALLLLIAEALLCLQPKSRQNTTQS